MSGLIKRGMAAAMSFGRPNTSESNSCICTDLVNDAAKQMKLDMLAACKSPSEIAACPDVELVYSLDLGKE